LKYIKSITPSLLCGLVAFIVLQGVGFLNIFKAEHSLYFKLVVETSACLGVYAIILKLMSKQAYNEIRGVIGEITKKGSK
jgi:hypothetical protein